VSWMQHHARFRVFQLLHVLQFGNSFVHVRKPDLRAYTAAFADLVARVTRSPLKDGWECANSGMAE